MKKLFTIFAIALFAAATMSAQENDSQKLHIGQQWKYAFSKEGIKEWKPEFTYRQYTGFCSHGPMVTAGVRVDEKRSFALLLDHNNAYIDAAPGDVLSIRTGLVYRRYVHMGKRKIFALYSDLYAGVGWVYKIKGNSEDIWYQVGDATFLAGWNPGIRIRLYKNIHIFAGPTLSTEPLFGFHAGIGF